jgi:hypothetical protein
MEGLQMRIAGVILSVALLGAFLIGCTAADGTDSSSYTLKPEAREELIAFMMKPEI